MTPGDFNANSRQRASDADRDRAASVINAALADGRLTAEEHSQRLDSIYAAKTYGELVPLLDDLSAAGAAQVAVPTAGGGPVPADRGSKIIAIFGGATRRGIWRVPRASTVLTVFGGADLDLRDAVLDSREVTIRATCVFGGVSLTVPPEMHVVDSGSAVFGGRDVSGDSPESLRPDAPTLRLTGTCVFGGVAVVRRARKERAGSRD